MFGWLLPCQLFRLVFIFESDAVIHPASNLKPYKANKLSDLCQILVTCHLEFEGKKASRRSEKRLVFDSSYVHVRPCGGLANRGVAVSRPGLLGGPHASLHPCRMCRWWARLAQNRPREPQPRESGRPRLSLTESGKWQRQTLPERRRWLKWSPISRPSITRGSIKLEPQILLLLIIELLLIYRTAGRLLIPQRFANYVFLFCLQTSLATKKVSWNRLLWRVSRSI